eukprot:CAMPEP_0198266138 /NCGR_PEP_ID=MMETSP1447-20131203/26732_1 /TAXON_ID=420782 /ORGANISM="Chaetoceros dichaeta, Strain CCMP1751" /LENGTH=591 /DNA_ID=CAMNT_0043956045 /DNA_START=103 /DNA_END=1878 /DNA_ORIENTATION=-
MKKKKRRRQKKKNSALVPAPTSASSKKRNRSHKASGSNNGAPSPLVHLPHAKITLRHVGDVDKYGNYSKMIDLIRKLVGDVNASLLNGSANALSADKGSETFVLPEELSSIPIILEKSSIERVLVIEKSLNIKEAAKAVEGGEKKDGDVPKEAVEKVMGNEQFDDLQTRSLVGINTNVNSGTVESLETASFPTGLKADIIAPVGAVGGRKEPEKEVYKNEISARVLYMVPPRKSRRRGVITGHAYIVLHPPMPRFIVEKAKAQEDKLIGDSGNINASNASGPSGGNIITAADRTKALAQSRLILRQTISNLAESCKADIGKEVYRGMKVEMSPSQKIWKFDPFPVCNNINASGKKGHGYSGHYHAKYDSTIEQSEDFQAFLDKRSKIEEEIANRPKPPPGGGTIEATVGVDGLEIAAKATEDSKSSWSAIVQETMENGQPIPALVLHLRQKKAAVQKSKSSKSISSSATDSKSKKSNSGSGKGKGLSNSGRGQSTSEKKGGKGGKKSMVGSSKLEGGSKKGQSSSSGGKKKQSEKISKKSYSSGSKKQNGSQSHSGKYKAGEKSSGTKPAAIAPAKILMKPAGSGGSNAKK